MNNTNDPVGVLRKVIHELRTYSPPADNYKGVHIHPCWAKEIEGALAAIQHSEQRETVPAVSVLSISWPMPRYRMETGYMQPDERGSWCKWIDVHPNMDSPPVAAPVPEAKAEQNSSSNNSSMSGVEAKDEQVYQWLVRVSKCGLVNVEPSARVLMDYYEGAEPETAPAVKHEASELQSAASLDAAQGTIEDFAAAADLVDLIRDAETNGDALGAVLKYRRGIREDAARQSPPIAVQGSIGDDAGFDGLLDDCENTHGEAYEVSRNRLVAYIDSRSPVAAAPEDVRKAALEEAIQACGAVGAKADTSVTTAFDCIDAIRALSAAAPSADAKGEV